MLAFATQKEFTFNDQPDTNQNIRIKMDRQTKHNILARRRNATPIPAYI